MLATLAGPPVVVVGLDPPHAAITKAIAIANDDVRFLITFLSLAALAASAQNCKSPNLRALNGAGEERCKFLKS
jgi:hypothetical protein